MGSVVGKLDVQRTSGAGFVGSGRRGGCEGRRGRRRSARHFARWAERFAAPAAEGWGGPGAPRFLGRFRWTRGSAAGARAWPRSQSVEGDGRERPHHPRGREGRARQGDGGASSQRRRRAARGSAGRLRQIRSRSRPSRSRASRRSPARGCMPPGSTFLTSRIRTKPTSPISTPSERLSTKTRRKTNQSLTASRCCRFSCERRSSTLKAFPNFNAALSPAGDSLILRRYWHIGVAVDTPDGLVVAVIKDVDQKGVVDLSRELGALSEKARAGKLAPAEMQGATFTISSLGGIGGTAFTPDRQRARSGDSRRRAFENGSGLGRNGVSASSHAAAMPILRPQGDRRRCGRSLHAPSRGPPGGHAAHYSVTAAR